MLEKFASSFIYQIAIFDTVNKQDSQEGVLFEKAVLHWIEPSVSLEPAFPYFPVLFSRDVHLASYEAEGMDKNSCNNTHKRWPAKPKEQKWSHRGWDRPCNLSPQTPQ